MRYLHGRCNAVVSRDWIAGDHRCSRGAVYAEPAGLCRQHSKMARVRVPHAWVRKDGRYVPVGTIGTLVRS
jgi:hypothetical protein